MKGRSQHWLHCKYIDKGNRMDYTLKITNVKQLLRFMNEKMKGNKVKAEVNILKWMIDKRRSIKNRRPDIYKPKMELKKNKKKTQMLK